MSDFAVGDVVVCVDAKAHHSRNTSASLLTEGAYYRISAVGLSCFSTPSVWLRNLRSDDKEGGFKSSRFRKIDAADEQFTAQMRACKPVRVGV